MICKDYDINTISFEQTACMICREDYAPQQSVVELKCKHIFHAHCYRGEWDACPICRTYIQYYSIEDVMPEVTRIFHHVMALSSSPRTDDMLSSALAYPKQLLARERWRASQEPHRFVNPHLALMELNASLQLLREGTPEERGELFTRDATALIEAGIHFFAQEPLHLRATCGHLIAPRSGETSL